MVADHDWIEIIGNGVGYRQVRIQLYQAPRKMSPETKKKKWGW